MSSYNTFLDKLELSGDLEDLGLSSSSNESIKGNTAIE